MIAVVSAGYMMLAFVRIYRFQYWILATAVTVIGVFLLFVIAVQIEHYHCGEVVCGKILGFDYLVYAWMMLIFGLIAPIFLSKYVVRKNHMLSTLILGR